MLDFASARRHLSRVSQGPISSTSFCRGFAFRLMGQNFLRLRRAEHARSQCTVTSFEYNGDLGHPPLRSTAAATGLAAVERIFASGLAPLSILSCAGRSDYAIGDFLARASRCRSRRGARGAASASRARALMCACSSRASPSECRAPGALCWVTPPGLCALVCRADVLEPVRHAVSRMSAAPWPHVGA